MKSRRTHTVHPLLLAAAAGAALATASAAHAQSSWSTAVNGSWFDGTKWTLGVPGSGTAATLGLSGAYTATLQNNLGGTCSTLTISNPLAVVNVFDNARLTVGGNISNAGLIQICGPTAPGNNTDLTAGGNITISGSGTLRLAGLGNANNTTAYLTYTAPSNVLTNASGHLIAGGGRIYVNLVNNGLVNADVSGKGLFLIDQPKTNNATMTATNGGVLQLSSMNLTQGASGLCQSSNNSPVQVVSASVTGGTLNGAGTSSGVQYYGSSSLDAVTLANLNAVTDNSLVNIGAGGVTNNGTWTVSDPAAPGNNARIQVSAAAATVGGTGTIRLQGVGGGNGDNDTAYLYYTALGNVLTNGASHAIKGYGRVYANLVNNGSVNADVAGKGIFMIDQPKTNNGTMTASNGGVLVFRSVTVTGNPAAQVVSTDSASPVQIINATMTGGGFTTSGTGLFQYFGQSNVLSNLTVNGTHQIEDNSFVRLATNLVNNGSWQIGRPAAPGNDVRLQPDANVSISGTGTIRLQGIQGGNGDNNTAYLYYGTAANVLTLGTNQQLLGYGRVYTNLVNNGTINADNTPNASGPANKGIVLMDQPKTNNATITSSNGGWWYIRGITLTNNGTLTSANNSGTQAGGGLENCTVNGGTISNLAGLYFGTAGTVNINASTITSGSGVQVSDNSLLNTTGLTNNGTIRVSVPSAPGNNARLQAAAATTTLGGTGTLRLQGIQSGNGDNDTAYLYYTAAANQLVNSATHTIAGYGRVYVNLVNNGTINADNTPNAGGPASKGIFFTDQPKTNNATITSSNGGFWYVRSTVVNNGPLGLMSSSNTTTSGGGFENCTIVAGSLTNTAGRSFGTAGTVTFDGPTITPGSVVLVNDNSLLSLAAGGVVNNGTLLVQSIGAPGNNARVRAPGAATISGTGIVKLQATGFNNDTSYLEGAGDNANPLTLGAGQSLTGSGRLYGNIVIRGTIAPDQPFGTPGATCRIDVVSSGTKTLTGKATYNCQLASTSAYDQIGGNGTLSLGGTLNLTTIGGFDPPVGSTYDVVSGPTVQGQFTTVNFPPLSNRRQGFVIYGPNYVRVYVTCYVNCDGSTGTPTLTANDFQCFLNRFAQGDPYANCDGSTGTPALTANDFQCFLNKFAGGCI